MSNGHDGIGTFKRPRPRWLNLRKDIVELFVEAQQPVVEKVRSQRHQMHEYSRYMNRPGFNTAEGVVPSGYYSQQRSKYTRHTIVPMQGADYDTFECRTCKYRAYSLRHLNTHRWVEHRLRIDDVTATEHRYFSSSVRSIGSRWVVSLRAELGLTDTLSVLKRHAPTHELAMSVLEKRVKQMIREEPIGTVRSTVYHANVPHAECMVFTGDPAQLEGLKKSGWL